MTATLAQAPPQGGPVGPPRRRGRTIAVVVVVAVAAVLAVVALVQLTDGTTRSQTTVDRATDPDGLRAFVLLLEAFDGEVLRGSADLVTDESASVDAVLVVPGVELSPDEWAELDRWSVDDGHLLVDATGAGVVVGGTATVDLDAGPTCDIAALTDVATIEVRGSDGIQEGFEGDVTCFPSPAVGDGGGYLVAAPGLGGGGATIYLGGVSPFTNRLLDRADNSVLATSLFAPVPGTTTLLVRGQGGLPTGQGVQDGGPGGGDGTDPDQGGSGGGDEGGDPPDEDGLTDLIPTGVRWGLLQLLVALVLFTWWRGRRVGAPVAEPLPVEIEGAELVAAVGDLLARRAEPGPAGQRLRTDTCRLLAGRLGLPGDADPATVVEVTARRTGRSVDEVAATLTGHPVDDADQLVRLAARLDALREEILHGVHA